MKIKWQEVWEKEQKVPKGHVVLDLGNEGQKVLLGFVLGLEEGQGFFGVSLRFREKGKKVPQGLSS